MPRFNSKLLLRSPDRVSTARAGRLTSLHASVNGITTTAHTHSRSRTDIVVSCCRALAAAASVSTSFSRLSISRMRVSVFAEWIASFFS